MKKILSVCVPTYNMETLLPRCLDSFLIEDEYRGWLEVIVVNDGSKDNSSKIAHEYAESHPDTFFVIDKPNGNYGSCINAALKVATGKYFRICDSDDKYETTNLVRYLKFMQACQSDLIFSSYKQMTHDSQLDKETICPPQFINKEFPVDDFDFETNGCGSLRIMHCLATRTEILTRHNYFQTEGISYTDTQFVFYSFLYAHSLAFFGDTIYNYYLGRDGQTMSKESLIRSHMQLFQNAERMVDDYVACKEKLSKNKRNSLMASIFLEIGTFYGVVFMDIKDNAKQLSLLQNLINKSKESINPCPIEERLLSYNTYRFWKRYHMPKWIIRLLVRR